MSHNWSMKTALLLGGSGRLGRSIQRELKAQGIPILSPTRAELNVCDLGAVKSFISNHNIEIIIHSASILTPRIASDFQAEKDSQISATMDNNVFKVVKEENLQLYFFSTALVYPSSNLHPWSESDFGNIPNPPRERWHYSMMKYESTRNVLKLAGQGIDCSAIILPNLLAGPIPTLDRNDQLCEKLFNLTKNAASSGTPSLSFNVQINPKLQLVAGNEIARWLSLVLSLNLKLPPILNLGSKHEATPVELLEEITKQKHPELYIVVNGDPQQTSSYLVSDSIAREGFFWRGGESLSISVSEWLSDPMLSSQSSSSS